ncbi:MAG TPA: zinc-binding alcohol dehydrogenase family protein [Kofleriaceae bacterium]
MLAAVLHDPTSAPRAEEFADPPLAGGEVSARVLAAGLHQLVRIHANGTHYSSHKQYPMIPGVDGVAELPDGRRAYIGWLRPPYGTFAERAAVDPSRVLEVPRQLAPERVAALVNPASSSWLALRLRAELTAGERVLVLGATGTSGQLAVQLARVLGAGRVVAVGRNPQVLGRLAADHVLQLDAPDFAEQLRQELTCHGTDIVLDYLWGAPAEATLAALLASRAHLAKRVRYVNIGQSAGGSLPLSPHVLRSMNLAMLGSGLGSVTPAEIARELPGLLAHAGSLTIDLDPTPLTAVDTAWTTADAGRRIVIMP